MPNIRDHDMSVYLKVSGTALQVGGYEPNPILEEVCDPDRSLAIVIHLG